MKTRILITLILLVGVVACSNTKTNSEIVIVNTTTHDTMTCKTNHGFVMLDTLYIYKVIDEKDNYLSNFGKFVSEIELNKDSYSSKEWEKKNNQFCDYIYVITHSCDTGDIKLIETYIDRYLYCYLLHQKD